jgi:hypothetical protein
VLLHLFRVCVGEVTWIGEVLSWWDAATLVMVVDVVVVNWVSKMKNPFLLVSSVCDGWRDMGDGRRYGIWQNSANISLWLTSFGLGGDFGP